MTTKLYCSFCGGRSDDRLVLIAGPGMVFICEKCTDDCAHIVADHRLKKVVREVIAEQAASSAANEATEGNHERNEDAE